MKISTTLRTFVLVLLIFSITSTSTVFYQLNNMQNDGSVVNYAGVVRGATQRLVKLEMSGNSSDELISKLDKIIKGLINGDKELKLPVATDANFISSIKEVENSWEQLKETIYKSRETGEKTDLVTESETYFEITNDAVAKAEIVSFNKVKALKAFQIVLFILNLIILIIVWLLSTKRISNPIMYLVQTISNLDISENIPSQFSNRKDEIGLLSNAFQKVIDNIRGLTKEIVDTSKGLSASSQELNAISQQVALSSEEIAKTVEEIARGATEQARDIEMGAIRIEELGRLVEKDQSLVSDLNTSLDTVNTLKDEGFNILEDLTIKTNANSESANEVQNVILSTNESANKIEKASQMIKNIADQTNLLALNAAIESARAGEHGKGFSVVAEEIRKLAEESNQFTEEISIITQELTDKTEYTVKKIEEVGKIAESQYESVKVTNTKFQGISDSIEMMKEVIIHVSQSANDMKVKQEEITQIIQNLSAVSEEHAAGTEETSASLEEQASSMEQIKYSSEVLSEMSEEMMNSLSRFKY
ncbi:methyl-accepting chemotaxis protein McpC [Gottschalkia acidurici 9a]|uniref:Methyl-accepting chemotaxis protein McpC n=1 Tax=Gottschalkia acidurici (strain ATCC 7906 / DSM 604 / BCRC 14475 / CIP 104303 / KCTC 5404 / NCIMB 10678 / 9a) TaxID=1128398 RepID=K0B180_GOTA9|nr:methyl-accepting chemotaxis protein [Gottschalkia acidurici]AFS79773.1 methyl-accepting chemotaxis protein McpC [Gottschalkia acidurici 9a]